MEISLRRTLMPFCSILQHHILHNTKQSLQQKYHFFDEVYDNTYNMTINNYTHAI